MADEPAPPSSPMRARLRRPRFRIALALGSIFVTLIVFEIGARLVSSRVVGRLGFGGGLAGIIQNNPGLLVRDAARGKRLVPNAHVTLQNHILSDRDIQIDVNSLGFRGAELADPKPPAERRVLFLGDSITLGDYLQEGETFVAQAGARLREAFPGHGVVAINAGVGDIGLKEEADILEETWEAARPDLVVVDFYLNDSRPPWGFPGEIGEAGWLRRNSALADALYRRLSLRLWVREKGTWRWEWVYAQRELDWEHDPAAFAKLVQTASCDWGAAWRDDSWPPVERELARIKALAEKGGFRVAVVAFPASFQAKADTLDDAPQRRLERIAAGLGFAYLDLIPAMRARMGEDIFYDQCHPREAASAWIGEAIADFLAERCADRLR